MPPDPLPDVRVGQLWQEIDPRFPDLPPRRVVHVDSDLVLLLCANEKHVSACVRKRFNGRRGGYRLVQDVETDNAT
jgi:hypothetical protein